MSDLTSNARVASSAEIERFVGVFSLNIRCESTRDCLLLNLGTLLWCNGLGRAIDDLACLDESLDQPVIPTVAQATFIDTVLAQIEVTTLTDAAMPVSIRYRLVAIVAADGKRVAWDRAVSSAGLSH